MADKVCTIVGMGSGISMSVARRFAQEGYALGMIARSTDKLEGYVQDIDAETFAVAADAAETASLESAIATIHDELGQTDVLLYNVAAVKQTQPSELEPENLIAHFRVNVAGALIAAQQCIPHMRERQQGTILFTGGGLGINPVPQYAALAATKAALRNLNSSLHQELKPDGVHVATVTVAGYVEKGTFFDPDSIAESFWHLHMQPAGTWDDEIIFSQAQA